MESSMEVSQLGLEVVLLIQLDTTTGTTRTEMIRSTILHTHLQPLSLLQFQLSLFKIPTPYLCQQSLRRLLLRFLSPDSPKHHHLRPGAGVLLRFPLQVMIPQAIIPPQHLLLLLSQFQPAPKLQFQAAHPATSLQPTNPPSSEA